MPSFRDLVVWQKAHALTLEIYRVTAGFPSREQFALTDQMRRAAASVAANIVEGHGTGLDGVFAHHLARAEGSLAETRYFLILARDLNYLTSDMYERSASLATEASKILSVFRKKVQQRCNGQ